MRALLIVNNAASTVDNERKRRVIDLLGTALSLDVVHTMRRGDATTSALQAADEGVEVVFCLGGDGTANETARGLLSSRTSLVSLPGGSTNVFSRSLGFPRDPEAAAAIALRSLAAREPTPIGIGEVDVGHDEHTRHAAEVDGPFDAAGRRPFLFHCGGGFDAQVTERVERTPHLKRRLGHFFFAAAAAATWIARDRASISVECALANGTNRGPIDRTRFAVASNSDPYSYLASRPLSIAPGASPEAPLVATAATTLSPVASARILTGALRSNGSITDARGVVQIDDVAEIRWRSETPFALQADGEPLGRWTDVRLRQRAAALRVVLPQR